MVAYPLARPRLAAGLRQVFGAPWRCIPVAGASGGGPFCQWPGPTGLGGCNLCAAGASKDSGWRVPRVLPPAEGWASGTGAPHAMMDNSKQKGDSMSLSGPPRSGRRGEWVYYMRGNKQCRRRYVRPRDPRTPAQLRVRQTFGAASKAWSGPGLSPQERQDVRAAAKKVKSRPRLRQSGHLFGQQYFVQQACLKKGKAQG